MMFNRIRVLSILLLFMLSLVAACGKSSTNSAASVYKVKYLPGTDMNAPAQGKTTFQLRITKQSDGSAATGLHPQLELTMSGMDHATPVDSVTESGTAGYYDCTVYYLMGGTWEMKVTVEGETTTFNPDVAMAMGIVRASLYGPDDIVVSAMSGTTYNNKYYIFLDGMISVSMPTLKLYISHGENMNMDFKPLSTGTVMSSPTGTVENMLVTASTDSTFVTNVTTTTSTNGHFSLENLSGLVSGATNTIYVKLNVNSQDKTTNGAAVLGSNAYGMLTVTPGD